MEDIDSVDIVASALDDFAAGKITWNEFSMQMHDKRYHPHGYKEGDTCRYRDRERTGGVPSKAAKDYYDEVLSSLEDKDALSVLPKRYGIEPVYATTADDLYRKHDFTLGVAMDIEERGAPVSVEVHKQNTDAFLSVVSDLRSRYPGFTLFPSKLISWKLNIGDGQSSVDDRSRGRTTFIALSDIFESTIAPSPYHVIRHEIGHNIATVEVRQRWLDIMEKCGSPEGYRDLALKISTYAATHEEEAIAEAFAFYTNPGYNEGTLPSVVEEFVQKMISDACKRKERFGMDNAEIKRREGVDPIDDIYYVSIDDFKVYEGPEIRWRDNKRGVLKFGSYKDMFEYAMGCYKVSEDWTRRFIAEFPSHKWTANDIDDVQFRYRETTQSLDDIVAFYKKWFEADR